MGTLSDPQKPENADCVIGSNRLEDILQCSENLSQRIVVTSATYPYHVEWINSVWSKACGWRSDEILGLDCKFLQGDVTDQKKVTNFMTKLFSTGGYSDMKVLNYHKDNTLLQNSIRCFPVIDNCGPDSSPQVSHIAAVLVETKEFTLSEEDMGLMEDWHLKEVGMPIDRREGCHMYPHCNSLPPPSALEWRVLTESLPLALMLRYMLRSQAPIVLTDRDDRIVHVNLSWVKLTGYAGIHCEGKVLSTLFDTLTDDKSMSVYKNLLEDCKKADCGNADVMYCDDNMNYFSACSTDSESSEETEYIIKPRLANIVLAPPSHIPAATPPGSVPSFKLNPWGSSRIVSKPKIHLSVCPAAIKSKHMVFLFGDITAKKADKSLKTDCTESYPVTRKRTKSALAPGLSVANNLSDQQCSANESSETHSSTCAAASSSSSKSPFGALPVIRVQSPSPSCKQGSNYTITTTTPPDENARKLPKCSSAPRPSTAFISAPSIVQPPLLQLSPIPLPLHSPPLDSEAPPSTTDDRVLKETPRLRHPDPSLWGSVER